MVIHDSEWFEMSDKRKPRLATASWVPLYAQQKKSNMHFPELGHWEEFFGAFAITFPVRSEDAARQLEWTTLWPTSHRPRVEDGQYTPAGHFTDWHSDLEGNYLVLKNSFDTGDPDNFLLEPDLILGLRLLQEGDCWVSPHEGYTPVIRSQKDSNGRTVLMEIRGEHLKDYLCAWKCGLLVSTYRSRVEISKEAPLSELSNPSYSDSAQWEGRVIEIDVNGARYGSDVAVFYMGRTDVDPDDDVPVMGFPTEGNTWSSKNQFKRLGPKSYKIIGEMWRNEWIKPGQNSPRIRGDREISNVEFIVDNSGQRLKAPELVEPPSRWLWFSPKIVNDLLSHRGTKLTWYTENTGGLSVPAQSTIHFGINADNLVNVHAKDIGLLEIVWQKLWAAWNVPPDGKVSRELLSTQGEGRHVNTFPPESILDFALQQANTNFYNKFGGQLFCKHPAEDSIWRNIHRFLAVDDEGFYRLMKELTRLCIERIDASLLKKLTPGADKKLGSLKRLGIVLDGCGVNGRDTVRELVGIYELRQLDSHLPSTDMQNALELVGVKLELIPIQRGKIAIQNVADCWLRITEALQNHSNE